MSGQPFPEIGGVAGTAAVIEDLMRTVETVERAAQLMEDARQEICHQRGIADNARAAAVAATQWYVDEASASLKFAQTRMQGTGDIASDLWDVARRLGEVAQGYLDAENASFLYVSAVDRAAWAAEDLRGSGIWAVRHGLALGSNGLLASWLRPDGMPPTSGYLTGPGLRGLLGPLHATAWYDLIVKRLSSATGILEYLWGEPGPTGIRERHVEDPMGPPQGFADLVGGLQEIQHAQDGAVAIQTLEHADGTLSYIAYLPGTSDPSLDAANPHDINGIFEAMAGDVNDAMILTVAALEAAGVPRGAEVMLVGYSQGGIGAYSLADNDEFRSMYDVTHVSTLGTPGDQFGIRADTEYHSHEMTADLAPAANVVDPVDQPNHTTTIAESPRSSQGPDHNPLTIAGSHDLLSYAATAAYLDANPGTSTRAWLDSASQYFDQDATSTFQVFEPVFPPEPGIPQLSKDIATDE